MKRDPVEEAFQIVLDPRVNRSMKNFLRRLVRDALIEAVNAGINQSNGTTVIEQITKRMVP